MLHTVGVHEVPLIYFRPRTQSRYYLHTSSPGEGNYKTAFQLPGILRPNLVAVVVLTASVVGEDFR